VLIGDASAAAPAFPRLAAGTRVSLRPMGRQDYADLFRWRADLQDLHLLRAPQGVSTFEDFSRWMDALAARSIVAAAMREPDERMAGLVQAFDVDLADGRCYMISYFPPEHRRQWIGREASLLFFDYLFRTFNLRKIYLEVAEFNAGWLGWLVDLAILVEEGRLRDHVERDGQYWDLTCLALYRERWREVREIAMLLFAAAAEAAARHDS
jgi:UDP-4-amino-4,6-dideoxy-N-acetyl-beta-L-altrosamine N-acetyltransferase